MKLKRLLLSMFTFVVAMIFSIFVSTIRLDAAELTLTQSNTELYQSAVTVNLETKGFNNIITSIRYVSGEEYTEADFLNDSDLGIQIGDTRTVSIEHNGVYTFFAQSSNVEYVLSKIEITNIDSEPDQVVLTQRTINDTTGSIIIDIQYLNKKSPVALMKYMDGKRSVDNFENYGTILTKEETGDYKYLSFKKNGEFSLYIEDECGNMSVTHFEITSNKINKGDDYVEISAARHIIYDLKKSGNQYYIELPKQSEVISYNQGDVIVFTIYDEETKEFNVISSGTYYLYMDNETVKELEKDCIRIIIEDELVTENELEVGDDIVAQFMTRAEAKQIGINISYFNNRVLFIGVAVIVVILVLFIIHRIRIKKATI